MDASRGPSRAEAQFGEPEDKKLTLREREIVRHVSLDCVTAEVAQRLQITEGTVKAHMNNIFHKLACAIVWSSRSTRFESGSYRSTRKRRPTRETHPASIEGVAQRLAAGSRDERGFGVLRRSELNPGFVGHPT